LIKQLLSRSLVLDILLDKTLMWDGPSVESVHNRGKDVACLLMGRLAALGRERNTRVIVVAQLQAPAWSHEEIDLKNGVLACASANQLGTVDLFVRAEQLSETEREALFAGSNKGHMNASGNRFVATELVHLR